MRVRTMWALLAAVAVFGPVLGGCASNPVTGERNLMLLSPADEVQIGREAAPQVLAEMGGEYRDPVIAEYVASVGQRVAEPAKQPDLPYEYSFTVVDNDMVNAFALPGGPIMITRGMLFKMRDEAELAGVLAHEVTHVAARHSAQQLSRQMGISFLVSLAGIIGSRSDGGGAYAGDLAKVVGQLVSLSYSREQEAEADRYGLDYMTRARYNPTGMVDVMKLLQEESGGGGPEFLQTHPNPENRIEIIRERIESKWPDAPDDASLTVAPSAYREHVLDRQQYRSRYSTGNK